MIKLILANRQSISGQNIITTIISYIAIKQTMKNDDSILLAVDSGSLQSVAVPSSLLDDL